MALIRISGYPEMNDRMRKELEELVRMPDFDIVTSDVPEWGDKEFDEAVSFWDRDQK